MDNLSASLEDYLELILKLSEKSKRIKAVEIARELNISRAAVSEALNKLVDKDLIKYENHKDITITDLGLEKAKNVILRHEILTSFFENILGIDNAIAEKNACRVEHVLSSDTFARLKAFQEYCLAHHEFIDEFKKGLADE